MPSAAVTTATPDLDHTQTISAVCAAACGFLAVALPLGVAAGWALAPLSYLSSSFHVPASYFPNGMASWQRLVGAGVTLVPSVIGSYGLIRARRSLISFAKGDFFAPGGVGGLRDFAGAIFWASLAGVVATPVLSVALTIVNAPGQRQLALGVSSSDLFQLLAAGIFWVIAAGMARASVIAREHAQIV